MQANRKCLSSNSYYRKFCFFTIIFFSLSLFLRQFIKMCSWYVRWCFPIFLLISACLVTVEHSKMILVMIYIRNLISLFLKIFICFLFFFHFPEIIIVTLCFVLSMDFTYFYIFGASSFHSICKEIAQLSLPICRNLYSSLIMFSSFLRSFLAF